MNERTQEEKKIPEEFKKIIPDFINDIKTTFPEYAPIINQWWFSSANDMSDEDKDRKIEGIFKHCIGIFPERFFDILYKNVEIFNKDSDINTEFLPGLSFKYLWNCDISDNTKETIWKYLQLISISVIGSVKDQSAFGDSAKFLDSINEDEFKNKLQETLEGMQNLFGGDNKSTDEGEEKMNVPSAEDIHSHLSGMLGGKLGDLAREIAEETAENLDMDMENITDAKDVFQKLFQNPGKLMNLVKNVGEKLDSKIKSGEINQSELMSEASDIMGKMKDMPGMGDIQSMLSQMGGLAGMAGMAGLGKNTKLNTGAMQAQMDRTMKSMKTGERMKKNLEIRKAAAAAAAAAANTTAAPQKQLTEQEIQELINSFEKPERTPRDKGNSNSNGKAVGGSGKKKKKNKK